MAHRPHPSSHDDDDDDGNDVADDEEDGDGYDDDDDDDDDDSEKPSGDGESSHFLPLLIPLSSPVSTKKQYRLILHTFEGAKLKAQFLNIGFKKSNKASGCTCSSSSR